MLDDIGEGFDSLPAEVSSDYLASSRYFSSISDIGQFPLLSPKAIGKLTEYAWRVKSKKRVNGEEWDIDAFSKVLRLVERVMREGDDLPAFREIRSAAAPSKAKKGKKNSHSPDLSDKDVVNIAADAVSEDQLRLLDSDMARLADAGSAAVCALTLLDLDGLPKQVSKIIGEIRIWLILLDILRGDHILGCFSAQANEHSSRLPRCRWPSW